MSVDTVHNNGLLIPMARLLHNGREQWVTPEEYNKLPETVNRTGRDVSLCCPIDCELVYVKQSMDGKRPHFRHKCTTIACGYIRKYDPRNTGMGESPEHTKAKLLVGDWASRKTLKFVRGCGSKRRCGVVIQEIVVPENWKYMTEQSTKSKSNEFNFIVDGVFVDHKGEWKLVVEVKHTHGTSGRKRDWIRNQSFQYVEVDAMDVNETKDGTVTILDTNGDIPICGSCEKMDAPARTLREQRDKREREQREKREDEAEQRRAKRQNQGDPNHSLKHLLREIKAKRDWPRRKSKRCRRGSSSPRRKSERGSSWPRTGNGQCK